MNVAELTEGLEDLVLLLLLGLGEDCESCWRSGVLAWLW